MSQSVIPADAHLFFPKAHAAKCTDAQRMVFDGNTKFNDDEIQMITKFKAHCQSKNFVLKPLWTDNMILRFLYANNFKMAKAMTSIKEHTTWRETFLPIQLDDPLRKLLNSGIIYVHGRDNQFRPIVIFNIHMVDPKKHDADLMLRVLTFYMEYVISEWMLPGQIETWVFMVDLKGMAAATLALGSMRKLFSYLQDNFKCRLSALYALNVTNTIYIPYQVVKGLLDEVTVQKIQFYKTQIPTNLFKTTNAEQVEEKFGGSAPNATQFWPPRVVSDNYFVSPDDSKSLTTREHYTSLYKSGHLKNMQVNQSLIVEDTDDLYSPLRPKKVPLSAMLERRTTNLLDPSPTASPISFSTSSPYEGQTFMMKVYSAQEETPSPVLPFKVISENLEDDDQEEVGYHAIHMDETFHRMQKAFSIKTLRPCLISSLSLPCTEVSICD